MEKDFFADIASSGMGGRSELLSKQYPEKINKHSSILKKTDYIPLKTPKKMSTKEELGNELESLRKKYESFLKNYAPEVKDINKRIYLKEFFVDGVKTTIPDYGAPCGYAKKVYETEFIIDKISSENAVYICFKGADYKAVVYINGTCVGIHKGFFSPFEFNIDENIKAGSNKLKIELYNDYVYLGYGLDGDKLYAATGLGWDDSKSGWHHCPPGMGLYNDVYVEIRKRVSISDIFVRENEVWVDVENADYSGKKIEFNISVYGQNFQKTVLENYRYIPETTKLVGLGDILTEKIINEEMGHGIPLLLKKGINLFKIPIKISDPMIWDLETPYLYQIQIEVYKDGELMDKKSKQFGIRSFNQDVKSSPKGMFYLNGRKIRLRGANTMGFEQQDVLRKDFNQLIDDILLAKICNINFFRLTQRPVQDEVYEYCDKLGLLTQTDLPLFGCMRRTEFAEGVRQAEEMERLIRNHPCNILISYINEPFPNANNEPHRHLVRSELENFFDSCDKIVLLNNPDRVIKHVDGDYDPPCSSMPDNHCYPMWYNGHGVEIGKLHKGYWLPVKSDWYYGCGEYGCEGLDNEELMFTRYPEEWIKEPFSPVNIPHSQTGRYYRMYYDEGDNIKDWVEKSQRYQAFATKMMTQAFRRNKMMVSNAIHLFIDAWPAGWMKAIMDCQRNPKPAFFEYKNSNEPIMISLRTDKFAYYSGEKISVECYVCNDTQAKGKYKIVYEVENMRGECEAVLSECDVSYVSDAEFYIDNVRDRKTVVLKAVLLDSENNIVADNKLDIEVFSDVNVVKNNKIELICDLKPGEYDIAGEKVEVKACPMLPLNFVSRKTNHETVKKFKENDFSFWYNKSKDRITPIIYNTFNAEGFMPILLSVNTDNKGRWQTSLACGAKKYKDKWYVICNVDLRLENPVAKHFLKNIYEVFN